MTKAVALHLALVLLLYLLQFVVGDYHALALTRVMLLSIFAVGYNVAFGYAGLLSLGHAMFFAAGLYTVALGTSLGGMGGGTAFLAGVAASFLLALAVGALALRTTGVAFMIVTMMFAQAAHLMTLYFGEYTRGDEGIVLPDAARRIDVLGGTLDLADAATRYDIALALFALSLLGSLALARSSAGRVLVAIRENEARAGMLGYDVQRRKLAALVLSGTLAGVAGAAYGLMFAYAGSTFASIQYSIYPLLWTLVGGAGTVAGPFVGTLIMFYLVDLSSGYTSATLLAVGAALILLVLFFPKGIVGTIRDRWLPWIP